MAAPSNPSPVTSRMSSSPKGSKKSITKVEEPSKVEATNPESTETSNETKPATSNAPLAPPPKPATTDAPDYFSHTHGTSNPFSLEPNVFEQSFGNPSVETPGRTILPPVANITSPSPLPGITPGWSSLRSGPLSPAMLAGPTSQTDYFGDGYRGFPTPNESSLRTGLTPGGGGSMFPAPSPNTAALLNSFQSGGITPSTADFQASAARAAEEARRAKFPSTSAPTSQPDTATASMSQSNNFQQAPAVQQQRADPFSNHDVSNAANDLLSFATQNGAARNGASQFSMPSQQQPVTNAGHMPVQAVEQNIGRRNTKGSINSMAGSADTGDLSESDQNEQTKTNTRSRAKKGGSAAKSNAGNKRKADETKGGSRKKANNGPSASLDGMEDDSEEETSPKPEDGRKMTDEEKRKNFLERNRVAALKCRQRKKQWLANLQSKVEMYSTENDALSVTVTQLREEIVNLKTILLAHKECPVSVAQGINGINMNAFLGSEPATHQNPYGIAQMVPNGVQMSMPMQAGSQMQNRFVYPLPRPDKMEDEENPPLALNPYLRTTS